MIERLLTAFPQVNAVFVDKAPSREAGHRPPDRPVATIR
jgi:hypothetical protein